jgi:hypothetical protein
MKVKTAIKAGQNGIGAISVGDKNIVAFNVGVLKL